MNEDITKNEVESDAVETDSISKEKKSQIVFSKEAITLKAIRQIISIYQDRFDFEVKPRDWRW